MKIQMTVGLEGPELSLQPGDLYEPDDEDEATRLIDAGFAIPFVDQPVERAVKKRVVEKRDAEPVAETPAEEAAQPAEAEGEANA